MHQKAAYAPGDSVNRASNNNAACGGDGTVGWILSVMDSMTFPIGRPSIGIIPLGTGNDLSRSLNWGGKYKSKPLKKFLRNLKIPLGEHYYK